MMLRSPFGALATPVVAVLVATLAPVPAAARETPMGEAIDKLGDAGVQASVAAMVAALGDALLDLRVGPMLQAAEGLRGNQHPAPVAPDTRLRDLAGADADAMPAELARQVPAVMQGMSGMAGAMEAMLPELEAMARRMESALPRD